MILQKPKHLNIGDTIATVSISNGWAGDVGIYWKYKLGVNRLKDIFGLNVVAAPNSLKGSDYLSKNPKARAEDIMWAFENANVKAIIANVGGNDSIRVIPFIDCEIIKNNHKIFIGYSDVQNIHLLCYKAGLSTFYGPNLLYPIAEAHELHSYSEKWFKKVLFDNSPIGKIEPAETWTFEPTDYLNKDYIRQYYPSDGYSLIQGSACVKGRLIGGHTTGIMESEGSSLAISPDDFNDAILFVEDIPEFFSPIHIANYFMWLGKIGALQKLNGIIIGKINQSISFDKHKEEVVKIMSGDFGLSNLPILYGLNFGHSSPICILPYGAMAEINCDKIEFSILESGVL